MNRTISRSPLLAAAIVSVSACGDINGFSPEVGLYQLESVFDEPLPYSFPVYVGGGTITHGDIMLRADGTFSLGLPEVTSGTPLALLSNGEWDLDDTDLTVRFHGGGTFGGVVAGDSLVLLLGSEGSFRYTFRRVELVRSRIPQGDYVLTSMAGETDLLWEFEAGSDTFARAVRDTITLIDHAFFRRHRSEDSWRTTNGDSVPAGGERRVSSGRVRVGTGFIVLEDYVYRSWPRVRYDTLYVVNGTFVRTKPKSPWNEPMEWEEVYKRVP